MRIPIVLLCFLLLPLTAAAVIATTLEEVEAAVDSANDQWRRDIILGYQEKMLHDPVQAQSIQAQMDRSLESWVQKVKEQWRAIPRPADRQDDDKKAAKGDALWYLKEIPQWWVTATVVDVLSGENDKDEILLVHQSFTGETAQVTRGQEVRVVAPEDQMSWDSEHLRDKGELARLHGRQEERRQFYHESIQVDPSNPHPMDNLGLYFNEIGEYKNARYWYEKAIQALPKWYHAYYNMGLLFRDNPHSDDPSLTQTKALELFEKAFQLNPLFLDSLWNIADLESKLGHAAEECLHWRQLKFLNRNPSPDERDFGTWNATWEDFTTIRIQECMAKLQRKYEEEKTNEQSKTDGDLGHEEL